MNSVARREEIPVPERRKRIITESRKEQNRVAQRAYRQRQKERRQRTGSSSHTSTRKCHPPRPCQIRSSSAENCENVVSLHAIGAAAVPQAQSDLNPLFNDGSLELGISHVLSDSEREVQVSGPGDDFGGVPLFPSVASSSLPCMNTRILSNSGTPNELSSEHECMNLYLNGDEFSMGGPFTLNTFNTAEHVTLATSGLSSSASAVDSVLMSYCYPHQELLSCGQLHLDAPLCSHISTQASGNCPRNHSHGSQGDNSHTSAASAELYLEQVPGVDALISAVSNFLNPSRNQQCSSCHSPPLPDLYSNSILCFQTTTLLPCLHNARCIGLELQDLLAMRSTFYCPKSTMVEDAASLLAAARKPWIPMHLQPTLAQVLFPHHPYLNLLPFPTLRERAIMFATMINPMELKMDIFLNGLACYPGLRNGESLGSKQPWDIRSWEVKPWFLRKRRLLMDSPATDRGQLVNDVGDETLLSAFVNSFSAEIYKNG